MSKDERLVELARIAGEEELRTTELEERATSGVEPEGEEEAFLRAALARAGESSLADDALVARAMDAVRPRAAASHPGPPAPATHRPTRWARLSAPLAGGLALAAAVALVIGSQHRGGALPAYEPVVSGGDAPDRAAPASAAYVVSPGAQLRVVARPQERVEGEVAARAFAGCGGSVSAVSAPLEVAATGAVRLDLRPEELFGVSAAGRCQVVLVVGRPGRLPSGIAEAEASPGVRVLRVDLDVKR